MRSFGGVEEKRSSSMLTLVPCPLLSRIGAGG